MSNWARTRGHEVVMETNQTVTANSDPVDSADRQTSDPPVEVDPATQPPGPEPSAPAPAPTLELAPDPEDPESPADLPAPGESEIADLRGEISSLKEMLLAEQKGRADAEKARTKAENEKTKADAARADQAEKARLDLLEQLGIIKWEYAIHAPTVKDASPYTEEGRRVYAKFRAENEQLFKGTPKAPAPDPTGHHPVGRKKGWRDVMQQAAKGITR